MKHIDLPTKLETFLENHIMSCKGASLIQVGKIQVPNTVEVREENKLNYRSFSASPIRAKQSNDNNFSFYYHQH